MVELPTPPKEDPLPTFPTGAWYPSQVCRPHLELMLLSISSHAPGGLPGSEGAMPAQSCPVRAPQYPALSYAPMVELNIRVPRLSRQKPRQTAIHTLVATNRHYPEVQHEAHLVPLQETLHGECRPGRGPTGAEPQHLAVWPLMHGNSPRSGPV